MHSPVAGEEPVWVGTMVGRRRAACRMLVMALVGATTLVTVAERASGHAPHDDITQVLASPAYRIDNAAFTISRSSLMRSIDGGSTWTQIVNGIDRPYPNHIAIAPSDPRVMYLAMPGGGVYRSLNQGSSWGRTPTPVAARNIAQLAVSPVSPNIVFAAGASSGLFRTTNGGDSWTAVGSFGRITAVVFSGSRVVVGDANGAVHSSSDNGSTWAPSTGTVSGDMVTAAAAIPPPATGGAVFVGTLGGRLFRSTDRGASFVEVGSGVPDEQITAIAVSNDYASDGTVWLTAWSTGVYRSIDRGVTFSITSVGLTTDPQATAVGRPHFGGVTVASTSNDGQVLFVAGFDGLFRSDDRGDRWAEIQTQADYVVGLDVSPGYDVDATAIVTSYVKGAYLTTDGGRRWAERNVGLGSLATKFAPVVRLHNVHFSPDYATDGTIFSATQSIMLKSTDRAASWNTIRVGDHPTSTYRQFVIAVSPAYAQDKTVYVGTRQGEIYRSDAGGEAGTWSLLANVGGRVRSLVLSSQFPVDPAVYASTVNGIFKSMDAGVHWQRTGPSGISMLAISSDYSSDGTVFAGTDSGVFVTRNAGSTWTELTTPPLSTSTNVEAIAVSPNYRADRTVLVSALGRGLYRSSDGGATFAAVGTSLIKNNHLIADYDNPTSAPIQFSPTYARDRTIFGMAQDDVVKSGDGGSTWQVLNLPPAADFIKPPVVAAAPTIPQVTEGATGTTRVMRMAFDLTHPYASTVTVNWRTLDILGDPNIASSAEGDYVAASGTLTFPKASTRQYADVVVNGDGVDEPDELIVISLLEPTNASIGGLWGLGFGTIADDD
jgi:photosystem II stability/assembly factor-like uncharacterized protein